MDIFYCSFDFSVDRMYCPSTNENILSPSYDAINEEAEAFIAYWHGEVLEEPSISDPNLKLAWESYYKQWEDSNQLLDIYEAVEEFLQNYDNPLWIVYECSLNGMACGPTSTTVYHVVKADTIIEEDPDFDAEEHEKKKGIR